MRLMGQQLSAARNDVILWRDINFCLSSGQSLHITGNNGVGKSTLLRAIAGLHKLQTGCIKLELQDRNIKLPSYCHYLSIKPAMKDLLTVEENLRLWQDFTLSDANQLNKAIEKLHLTKLRPYQFGDLSAGQKRRVAFARLLLQAKPIWLLDEPFLCLDAAYSDMIKALLQNHLTNGGIIIMATHEATGLAPSFYLNLGEYV